MTEPPRVFIDIVWTLKTPLNTQKVILAALIFQVTNLLYHLWNRFLDISQAQFREIDIRGIPAHLIRLDPLSQIVITREKALTNIWRQIDLSKTYWPTAIEFFLKRGDENVVLVAPKNHPKYEVYLEGIKTLQQAGLAD